jgi:membrane associated rhomboid family serine protease
MTPTPVGMRCPECSRERTRVTSGPAAVASANASPATFALIVICVGAYMVEIATASGGLNTSANTMISNFGLQGAAVADGEWYRLITGGFLHAGLLHLGFNMFALYFLGRLLEPSIGTPRFLCVYLASLLAGSFGAILLSDNFVLTVGASGAVFGIFGATFIIARGRGMNTIAREIGVVLGINLLITFAIPGISIGGHLGGLIGGVICGALIVAGERGRLGSNAKLLEYGGFAGVGIFAVLAAISFSEPTSGLQFVPALISLLPF